MLDDSMGSVITRGQNSFRRKYPEAAEIIKAIELGQFDICYLIMA